MTRTRDPRPDTGDGWRLLGFYHEPDHNRCVWRFVGTASGLSRLAHAVRRSAEREHGERRGVPLGPYEDLTIVQWERPGIDDQGIHGPPEALVSLAALIEQRLGASSPGTTTIIGAEYASDVEYQLRFDVREEGFDPASVVPVVVDEDLDLPEEATHDDGVPVSPSVPCSYHDPDAAFTETEGLVHLEGFEVVLEFQTKDAVFGVFKGDVTEVRVPLDALSSVRFKRGILGAELALQGRDMKALGSVPTAKVGRVRLKFKRVNRDAAEELGRVLERLHGQPL